MGHLIHVLDRPHNGRQLATLAVQVWAEAGRSQDLSVRLSGYYCQMSERFTTLVQRYQRHDALNPHHLAQVLTAMGPAFLSQRALLDDVSAATFSRGVSGLLAIHPGPGPIARQEAALTPATGLSH